MASALPFSLRGRQISSLEKVLNLNHDAPGPSADAHDDANTLSPRNIPVLNEDGDPIWKVLVFDDMGRDIISSVLRVNDLRTWGVTIHLNINSTRYPIPDVPVLYFVEPTPKNIELITSDLVNGLYSPAYVNFLYSIPRPLLEDFASKIAESGTSSKVAQVYDQYLNFIVAEPDLFSLGLGKDMYFKVNSAQSSDEQIDEYMDQIVNGLLSVSVTMGSIPIIRCPKGNAAELVATRLDRKLRDHLLNSKDNLFSNKNHPPQSGAPSSRPVLIIVDRNVDLVPMLSHSWTYQSLVHDILDWHLNRVTLEIPIDDAHPEKGKTQRSYDVNSNDFFWAANANVSFPQVAENIDVELTKYKADAAEVTRKTGAASVEDLQHDMSASAQVLKDALIILPELRERKAILDMHMNIATAILNQIKDRQLDNFFQLEENINKQNKTQMMDIIQDPERGTDPNDKLRLFLIWFLSTETNLSRAEVNRFEEALKEAGVTDIAPVSHVRRVRELTRSTMMTTETSDTQPQSSDIFRGFSTRFTGITSGALGANFDSLISGVKNFLPVNKDLTVTKIVESIMDPATASSSAIAMTENYLYFDPRSANARGAAPTASATRNVSAGPSGGGTPSLGSSASFGQRRQGFQEAIVFTVGGGGMEEYNNLRDWARRTGSGAGSVSDTVSSPATRERYGGGPARRVVYGSTELVNPDDFLYESLAQLGREN